MAPNRYVNSLRRQFRRTLRELKQSAADFAPGSDERFERLRAEAKRLYADLVKAEQGEIQ